ncbi:MAG: T9SS type A sorting domain-containing protein [Clostridia bacterium]|nr:T9SS type A sorting domain-containing protein [Clostridia bacterium]
MTCRTTINLISCFDPNGQSSFFVSISQLPAGVYVARIRTADFTIQRKLIIQ